MTGAGSGVPSPADRVIVRSPGVIDDLGDDAGRAVGAHVEEVAAAHIGEHLLGYRERDSGQPFRYRLIVRSGDAVSFGPSSSRS